MKQAILLHDHVSADNAEANHLPGKWVFSWRACWFGCYPARLRRMRIAWIMFV